MSEINKTHAYKTRDNSAWGEKYAEANFTLKQQLSRSGKTGVEWIFRFYVHPFVPVISTPAYRMHYFCPVLLFSRISVELTLSNVTHGWRQKTKKEKQMQKLNSKRSAETPARTEQTLDHERQVDVVDPSAVVEGTKMAGSRDVKEGVARPEEATDDHVGPSALMLEAPAEVRCSRDVLRYRVQEVDGPVKVGTLQQRLLEELGRRMHVQIVA